MKARPRLILVTGAHRSGSTWVGQILAKAKGWAYFHEPFNPIYPSHKRAVIKKWFLYIHSENEADYLPFFEKLWQWNYQWLARLNSVNSVDRLKFLLKYTFIHLRNRLSGKNMVIKDPIALFSTEWLVERFEAMPIVLIRHPAAFVYSLKRKNWNFPFGDILVQEALMSKYFEAFRPSITEFAKGGKDIIDQACLIWNLQYSVVATWKEKYPDWIFVRHEDLSLDPVHAFKKLYETCGLEYSKVVEAFVVSSTEAENPGGTTGAEENMKRNSVENLSYWKSKLNKEEIAIIHAQCGKVASNFYKESEW